MKTGKTSSAIAKLSETSKGVFCSTRSSKVRSTHHLNQMMRTILHQSQGNNFKKVAMRTHGPHGPSGLDAKEWRRILTHFGQQSVEITKTIAKIATKLATEELNPEVTQPYNACRLIPLAENPGVRPIGIGKFMRRIIGQTLAKCLKNDFLSLGSNYQLCLGQN